LIPPYIIILAENSLTYWFVLKNGHKNTVKATCDCNYGEKNTHPQGVNQIIKSIAIHNVHKGYLNGITTKGTRLPLRQNYIFALYQAIQF